MSRKKEPPPPKVEEPSVRSKTPLIFVSHDSQDAELAEAFGKLVGSVSAGVLKIFRSSDKKGTQGIEYGVEWFPKLMEKLESASDVVCLLTERSIERPWILYEAGVARGKLNTPVIGIALGMPLNRANTGPFAQFQNSDDEEESLTKVVMQLVERIPGSEPDHDAILMQVRIFKESAKKCLEKINGKKGGKDAHKPEGEVSIPKLFEEIKVMYQDLPTRIEQRISERPSRRYRAIHPMMLEELTHYLGRESGDPINILVISSIFRDEVPWFYEMGIETYHAMKSGDPKQAEVALREFQRMAEFMMSGPFMEMSEASPKTLMMIRDFLERGLSHLRMKPRKADRN